MHSIPSKSIQIGSIEFFDKLDQLYHTFFILREFNERDYCHSKAGVLVIALSSSTLITDIIYGQYSFWVSILQII